MKNYQAILLVMVGFGLGIGTVAGKVQSVIHFAGAANEMGFTFMGILIGMCGLFAINYRKLLKGLS